MSTQEMTRDPAGTAAGGYWPAAADWERIGPGEAGMDGALLEAAVEAALADHSFDVLVLRGGRIVAERYATGFGPSDAHQVASVAKSMVSVLVGVAIDEGRIKGLDQSASDFIPEWREGPRAKITLRHLLSMTSGLDFRGLAVRDIAGDQRAIDAAAEPIAPPGTEWAYATPMFHLLYHVLEGATGERFQAFAERALVGPLGMSATHWVTGEGRGEGGPVTNFYTAACSGRDLARFGLFALRDGRWRDRRLVSDAYFRETTSPSQPINPAYGLLWWTNASPGRRAMEDGPAHFVFEAAPRDAFAALGFGGQAVMAVPSLDLLVVRQGEAPAPTRLEDLLGAVCAAVRP